MAGLNVPPGEGRTIVSPLAGETRFIATADATDGALTALAVTVPPGTGPPLHIHTDAFETIFVVEGTMRFRLGDDVRPGEAGSFVFIPKRLPHCFQNVGESTARMVVTFSPSGMERFFELMASTPNDPEAFVTSAREAGMEVVGPPLGQSHPL